MIDKRTEVEIKVHAILKDVLCVFEGGRVGRPMYQTTMGLLRDAKVLLDNKEFGCPSGRHAAACKCV